MQERKIRDFLFVNVTGVAANLNTVAMLQFPNYLPLQSSPN